jgi:lipoprotein signal peptidase
MNAIVIIRIMAVALAGMYAMRTAYSPMEGRISPLTFLALAVLIFCIFIFHRVPTNTGWWAYAVLAGSAIGCGVNIVFMRLAPTGTIDHVISVTSAVCWAIIVVVLAFNIFGAARV